MGFYPVYRRSSIWKISGDKMLPIFTVLLSLMITTDAYTFLYPPPPMYPLYQGVYQGVHQGVHPVVRQWKLDQQPIVIQLAEHDCSNGDGVYPDLESACEKYYVCNEDRSWSYTCNPGLLFDAKVGACNWPDRVDNYCNASS